VTVFTVVLEELVSEDSDGVDDKDNSVDEDRDTEGPSEALVSVGLESVVGAAEGAALGLSVSVSA
jgi:hypothetical protein